LDIFPLISLSDILSIKKLIPTMKIIDQCDIKHIKTLPIKTIMSVLKVLIKTMSVLKVMTYIIIIIAACPIVLAIILVIMSVSTYKIAVILYFFVCKTSTLNNCFCLEGSISCPAACIHWSTAKSSLSFIILMYSSAFWLPFWN